MADAQEDKTEDATETKVRDALDKGNVPVSREVAIFASLAGMLIIAGFLLKSGAARLATTLERMLDDPAGWSLGNATDAALLWRAVFEEAAGFLLPLVAALALAGIAASVLQNAPRLVLHRIAPDPSHLSLGRNWSRIFGRSGQAEFLKSTCKFLAVGSVVFVLLRSEQARFLNAMFVEPSALPELSVAIAMRLIAAVAIATVLIVSADIVWSRVKWRRELRMTRQEVKDEHKQIEGDPLVKARLRSLALDRSRKRMIGAVPRASVVIANPTHYAVALRYVREEGGAPLVLAKGQDLVALKNREVAEAHAIPVVEDKALARSLYDNVEVDRMIPAEFYRAVAEVIHVLTVRKPGRIAPR